MVAAESDALNEICHYKSGTLCVYLTCNGCGIKGTQSLCLGAGMECPARVEGEIPPSQVMGYRHLILGISCREK